MWTDKVRLSGEVAAGAWIRERLTDWSSATGVIPSGFPAYARILHGIETWIPGPTPDEWESRLLTWGDVAAVTGRVVHAGVQWHALIRAEAGQYSSEAWDDGTPEEGNLEIEPLAELRDIAARHTSTPNEAWFALWEGWGEINGGGVFFGVTEDGVAWQRPVQPLLSRSEQAVPRLELPDRTYHLFSGPLSAIEDLASLPDASPRSPQLWWPADQAWCVASEIDYDSTLVGGSAELIREIIASPTFEAFALDPRTDLTWDGDQINR